MNGGTNLDHEVDGNIGSDSLGSASLWNGSDIVDRLGRLAALGESSEDLHLAIEEGVDASVVGLDVD